MAKQVCISKISKLKINSAVERIKLLMVLYINVVISRVIMKSNQELNMPKFYIFLAHIMHFFLLLLFELKNINTHL